MAYSIYFLNSEIDTNDFKLSLNIATPTASVPECFSNKGDIW